jgi:hypothetical protein
MVGLNDRYNKEVYWIKHNTTKPKWKWDNRFPKRAGRLLGVYLSSEDAVIYKLRFGL